MPTLSLCVFYPCFSICRECPSPTSSKLPFPRLNSSHPSGLHLPDRCHLLAQNPAILSLPVAFLCLFAVILLKVYLFTLIGKLLEDNHHDCSAHSSLSCPGHLLWHREAQERLVEWLTYHSANTGPIRKHWWEERKDQEGEQGEYHMSEWLWLFVFFSVIVHTLPISNSQTFFPEVGPLATMEQNPPHQKN